jgi:tetratricopeptide (TPR) repeat protein
MKRTGIATDAIRDRIFSLCHEKKYESAIKEAKSLTKPTRTHKQKAFGVRMLAYILAHQEQTAEAANLLLKAVKGHPADRAIHSSLTRRLIDCARYPEAIQFAERLIKLDRNRRWRPYTDLARFHKAYAMYKLGKLDEAEAELKHVADENNIWIDEHLATKASLLGEIARAKSEKT